VPAAGEVPTTEQTAAPDKAEDAAGDKAKAADKGGDKADKKEKK
jgi:hypothetical protein